MEPVGIVLGATIAKTVFKVWFEDNELLSSAAEGLTDVFEKIMPDWQARRAAERQLERLSEKACHLLQPMIKYQWSDLSSSQVRTIVNQVSNGLSDLQISSQYLATIEYSPAKLVGAVCEAGYINDLEGSEKSLGMALASQASELVVDLSGALPQFHRDAYAEIMKRESDIMSRLDRVIQEFEKISSATLGQYGDTANSRFEQLYRITASRNLDRIELFGLDAGTRPTSRQHNLSTAYISLSVNAEGLGGESAKPVLGFDGVDAGAPLTNGLSMRAEQAAAVAPRVVIKGEAGSGKTTLLQSLAVRSATAGFESDMEEWNDLVPFFVRLRALSGDALPAPQDLPALVAPTVAGTMPANWAHEQLHQGRGLVLVDGLDEVSEARREATRKWVADIIATFPQARVIVTSRPPAVPDGWLSAHGFAELELLPMSPADVSSFIDHWHEAVAKEEQKPEAKEHILSLAAPLKERVRVDRTLRDLASTPLLCAMLCAMNRDRRQVLPENRISLYDAAVQMILHGRDEQRRVKIIDLPRLDFDSKLTLLQEIAFWMMQNEISMADEWRVVELVERILPQLTRLPNDVTSADIVRTLVLRSGIIRSPIEGKVDFIHNAFKEYLCARAVSAGDRFGYLQSVLKNEAWREVAVLAVALTDDLRRSEFIRQLLAKGGQSSREAMYHLLAVRCLETCTQLDQSVQLEIKERLKKLRPPASMSEARALSAAGDMALPLLQSVRYPNAKTAAACVRALRWIGTPGALEVLVQYGPDPRVTVVKELLAAWPFFERAEYASRVLADNTLGRGELGIQSGREAEGLRFLKHLSRLLITVLDPIFDERIYSELTHLQHLTRLEIRSSSPIDMGKLSAEAITSLSVTAGQFINIDCIGNLLSLENISLLTSQSIDMSNVSFSDTLKSATISASDVTIPNNFLVGKDVSQLNIDRISDDSRVDWLPELTNLRGLSIGSSYPQRDIEVISEIRNLKTLHIRDAKYLEHLELISSLNKLSTLILDGAERLTDLSPLISLNSIHSLRITGADALQDIRPILELQNLRELTLEAGDKIDLRPLSELQPLQRLFVGSKHMRQIEDIDLKETPVFFRGKFQTRYT